MRGAPLTLERAEAALARLAIIATRRPAHLPLFDELASRVKDMRAADARQAITRQHAADLAWQARLDADPEFAAMLV
jgi:hypothetical protein